MELILFLLFSFAFALGGSWLFSVSGKKKSHRLLHEWAAREGVALIQIEEPLFDAGPFMLRFSRMQRIYRLRIVIASEEKILWARLGSWWFGLLKPEITIKEEPNQQPEPMRAKGPHGSP